MKLRVAATAALVRLTPSGGVSTLVANTRSTHHRPRKRRDIVELTGRQQEIWTFLVD
jgi:hypothetical protein